MDALNLDSDLKRNNWVILRSEVCIHISPALIMIFTGCDVAWLCLRPIDSEVI